MLVVIRLVKVSHLLGATIEMPILLLVECGARAPQERHLIL